MAFWDRIGRALSSFGDWLTKTEYESPAEPVEYQDVEDYPEDTPAYDQGFGDFFTPAEKSWDELPESEFVYERGEGPYPGEWGNNEIHYWDTVADGLVFRDRQNYEDAIEDFEGGYLTPGLSKESREAWRENFAFDMDMPIFDEWEAHREYWDEISPPM